VWAQNVKITPLGSHEGELCANDRATLFEDPTGVRILYDVGHTLTGPDDPRLGDIHLVLLSHVHGDHIGDQKLKAPGAGTCSNSGRVPAGPNSMTAEVAAAKNAALVMTSDMGTFVGARVRNITGGKPITGWTASSNGNYTASGVTTPFRQLYVNGVKAIRARSPNLGANGSFAFNRITGADNTAQNIQVAASEVGSWNNLTKVEMHIMTGWGDNTLRLASLTTSGTTAYLKIQSPESTIVFVRPYPHLGGQFSTFQQHVYYFENALELLDQPGEWYLDETQNVLHYKPRSGEDMTRATVVVVVTRLM